MAKTLSLGAMLVLTGAIMGVHTASVAVPRGIAARDSVASAASSGCSASGTPQVNTVTKVSLNGRYYLLYLPTNYKSSDPAPLVLSYHGGTQKAEDQVELDLLTSGYFNQDYIVVYPNGVDETWQGVPGVTTDDVGFTSTILDDIESHYCIDMNRIYATGKSQGGGFVGVLACDAALSQRIAAFSPVSGAFYVSDFGDTCQPDNVTIPCSPGRTDVPILDFHGLADSTISYYGGARKGGCLPTIPHWCQAWADREGLALQNTTSRVQGSTAAVRYEWGGGLVTHVMDGANIGHDWPSTQPNPDNKKKGHGLATFNATSMILDFFSQNPLKAIASYNETKWTTVLGCSPSSKM